MKCDNCNNCVFKKIDGKLKRVFDWANKSTLFTNCGTLLEGNTANISCLTKAYAKKINWQEIEKSYNQNKKYFDELFKQQEDQEKIMEDLR